jgi:hypothetical protein
MGQMSSHELILHRPESLRGAVASVNRAMERLGREGMTKTEAATAPLLGLWRNLVVMLDLGPPPNLRVCPACGYAGMRTATRCGFCWIDLAPIAERAPEVARAASGWRAGFDRALRYLGGVRE